MMVSDEYVHICNFHMLQIKVIDHLKEYVMGELSRRKIASVMFDTIILMFPAKHLNLEDMYADTCVVFQNKGVRRTPAKYILHPWKNNARENVMICEWDEERLSENSIKVCRGNDLYSLF